jgi:hypothetical protein
LSLILFEEISSIDLILLFFSQNYNVICMIFHFYLEKIYIILQFKSTYNMKFKLNQVIHSMNSILMFKKNGEGIRKEKKK